MADSTPLLPQMAAAADDREIVFNGVIDPHSPASLYGRNYLLSTGLAFYYFGGRFESASIANGFVTATASNDNYVVAARSNGAVSISTATTNWNDATNYARLYKLVAGGSTITSYEDHRQAIAIAGSGSVVIPKVIQVACSDETTALTTGVKITFRMPFAMTLNAGSAGLRASLVTAQASGSIFTVDVKESGSTILSTLLTIDNTEKTSTTATPVVISDASLADDAEITVEITQIGDGTAEGLKLAFIGT
jgi:hypothetical protein